MNAIAKLSVPRIGQLWPEQGGIYAGIIRGSEGQPDYHLIVPTDPRTSFNNVQWGERGKEVEGAQSEIDGMANTIAMAEAGSDLAKQIRALEVDGHKDLYLPSRHEARLCYLNAPDTFETDDWYWSSTQYSALIAWFQDFGGGTQSYDVKDVGCRARAVRRIQVSN